jgi:hypothetical protein
LNTPIPSRSTARRCSRPASSPSTDLIERYGVNVEGADEDRDPGRVRNNLAHLIESTKLAIREAQYGHGQTVAAFAAHCAESERTTETAPVMAEHEVQP